MLRPVIVGSVKYKTCRSLWVSEHVLPLFALMFPCLSLFAVIFGDFHDLLLSLGGVVAGLVAQLSLITK